MKSAVRRAFDRAFGKIAAENIGYRTRIDRKVNEAIWAKLGNTIDGSYAGATRRNATQRVFKYATRRIGARPIKMLFWECSDLNPIINGE